MGHWKEKAFEMGAFGNSNDDEYAEDTLIDEPDDEVYIPSTAEARENNIKGHIGEVWVRFKLYDEGYEVRKIVYKTPNGKNYFNDRDVLDLLQKYDKEHIELLEFLKSNLSGLPDYVCLKDNKLSFVEVKTNTSKLTKNQKEAIEKLKKFGYEVSIRKVKVFYEVEEVSNEIYK